MTRQVLIRRPKTGRWQQPLAICWIIACLLLGGASNAGIIANATLQFAAVIIIAGSYLTKAGGSIALSERNLAILFGAMLCWIALTIVPLPPAIWTHLPGRAFVAQGYRLLDMPAPWLPISLTDERTLRSTLALLVPLATYLVIRPLDAAGRYRLAVSVAAISCLSVMLGMAQLLGGPDSPLRPYEITNNADPVGFFANANHLASLLLMAIPMIGATMLVPREDRRRKANNRVQRLLGYGMLAVCVLGLALIRSNAGLLLMLPALAAAVLLGPARKLVQHPRFWPAVILGCAVFTALVIAGIFTGYLAQKAGVSASSRQLVSATTLRSAMDYLPTGTGLGSFSAIYLMKSGGLGTTAEWMNHAHDDPAEILLELGVPGLLMLAGFAIWFFKQALSALKDPAPNDDANRLARAATCGAALVLIHSFVDYPLRSAGIAAVFAMALAFLVRRHDSDQSEPAG